LHGYLTNGTTSSFGLSLGTITFGTPFTTFSASQMQPGPCTGNVRDFGQTYLLVSNTTTNVTLLFNATSVGTISAGTGFTNYLFTEGQ
jgi:hypothetical protein